MTNTQHLFTGSIPENYDKYLGPLILAKYTADLAHRLTVLARGCVLETAAGYGHRHALSRRLCFHDLLEHEVSGCVLGTDPFFQGGRHFYLSVLGKLLPVQL